MKPSRLLVILGAGSSYDCAALDPGRVNRDYRPPLVKELFEPRPTFNEILKRYPGAEAFSDFVRSQLNRGRQIEDILFELSKESANPLRSAYLEIPFYLQHLLGDVSQNFISFGSTKFETLVFEIVRSRFASILFLTVNYDLLLERGLQQMNGQRFARLEDYCGDNQRVSVVKLHGSVQWGRRLLNNVSHGQNVSHAIGQIGSNVQLASEITMLDGWRGEVRFQRDSMFFPSLAIPVAGKYEFACPKSHLEFAKGFIGKADSVIIIGFSFLDDHVAKLFAELKRVLFLEIVDGSSGSGAAVLSRFGRATPALAPIPIYDAPSFVFGGGFSQFMDSGRCRDLLGLA